MTSVLFTVKVREGLMGVTPTVSGSLYIYTYTLHSAGLLKLELVNYTF